jgi:hypothetical protein
MAEMALSFQALVRCGGAGADLLQDNHRWGAKSIAAREGALSGNLSVK